MLKQTLRNMAAGLLVWAMIVGALGLISIGQSAECLDAQECVALSPIYSHTGSWVMVQDRSGLPGLSVREIRRF